MPSAAVTPDEIITRTQLEQVRSLLGDVLSEVVTDNNSTLTDQISKTVTSDILREMDDLFQAKERREEEHFRKLDSLIRQQQANRRESAKPDFTITFIGCSFTWEKTRVIPLDSQTFVRFCNAFSAVLSRAGTLLIRRMRQVVKSFTTICSMASAAPKNKGPVIS